MNFTLRKPCKHCPFRSDLQLNHGWLGEQRAAEIAYSIEDYAFPCHKTTNRGDEEDLDDLEVVQNAKHEQLCYGAAVIMQKEGVFESNRMIQFARRFNMIDADKEYEENLPVFDSFEDFINTHADSRRSYVLGQIKFMAEESRQNLIHTFMEQLQPLRTNQLSLF